jgi:hypothetical protein
MTPTGTSGPDDSSRAPSSSPAAGSLGASNIVSRIMSSLGSLRLVPRRDSCGAQLAFADHQSRGGSATAGRAGATYLAWSGQEAPYSAPVNASGAAPTLLDGDTIGVFSELQVMG